MKNYALRHQIGVLQRSARKRPKLHHPGFSFAICTTNRLFNAFEILDHTPVSCSLNVIDFKGVRTA
jgi:hypothetical protein